MFGKTTSFVYGVVCYMISLATFAYFAGFLVNFGVPKGIDSGREVPVLEALAVNVALLAIFALQHSVMARPGFKRVWTRIIPPQVERSTYLLFSCLAMFLIFWLWQPMGGVVWSVESASSRVALLTLYAIGWAVVLITTFLINHFDLFGLRQIWLHLTGKAYTHLKFRTPGPYRLVRHPLYVGWLMVFWSAPVMTAAHLVFAIGTTLYILIAIQYEERDLIGVHPEYAEYRRRVPMMLPVGTRADLRESAAEMEM